MKYVIAVILFAISLVASADVTMQFEEIRLAALSRVVLGDVAKVPFLLSQEINSDTSAITVQTDKLKPASAIPWLRDVLAQRGFDLVERAGMYSVVKSRNVVERGEEVMIYRPSHRSVSYIMDLCKSFVVGGRWSTDRPAAAGPVVALGSAPAGAQGDPVPMQGSAGAQTSKESDVIVYEGSKAEIKRLRDLIAQVDKAPPQVVIQATLYEVSDIARESSAIAIAGEILGGRVGVNFGAGMGQGPWSVFTAIGGVKAVFSALNSDTRFKALARPNLRLLSGAQGRVSVGDETPILGAVTTNNAGAVTQAVEYRPSGHILQVTPVVLDTGVELTINQQSSSFVQTTTGVNNSPTLMKREVQSKVMLEPGSFVVLGGMQEQRGGGDVAGPKWFPDWAKRKSNDRSETELLLVLYVEKV